MIEPSLPSFIIIGAAKSATTWIVHQLQQHPSVFLPGPEPHYFSSQFHRGPSWYERFFTEAQDGQIVGEKSADYLSHSEAPRRIAQRLPEVQLVVQLRNPIERAYSDYCMFYRRGAVGGDPARYLLRSETIIPRFLEDGLYYRHLTRYLDFFPRERIRVILYDDIRRKPDAVVASLCEHIRVEPALMPPSLATRVKYKEAPMLPLSLRRVLRPVKHLADPWRRRPWFEAARNRLARPVSYPPLSSEVRLGLRDYYAYDVADLSRLLDRDVTGWLAQDAQPQ